MRLYNRAGFLNIISGNLSEGQYSPDKTLIENKPEDQGNNVSFKGLAPYKGVFNTPQLLHLLRRCLFGVSMADKEYFKNKSVNECLDILLIPSASPPPPLNYYNQDYFTDPDVPVGKTWINASLGKTGTLRYDSVKRWWVGQMLEQKRCLTEKMILFWHNHFVTEIYKVGDARLSYRHIELVRKHALGNFKKLTYEVTIDPEMLVYLNGDSNVKEGANENYARELQELFTVGKGAGSHYTEHDIKAAARVLTGWKVDSENIASYFDPDRHDTGDKTFSGFYNNTVISGLSGSQGAKETEQLIDMIFTQAEVARFICRKLYRWFVNSQIDSQVEIEIIGPLAEKVIANNFEMAPVLRTLLGSEHFFDSSKIGCIIKSPVEYTLGIMRQLDVKYAGDEDAEKKWFTWGALWNGIQEFGQNIGDPPDVAGWPAYYLSPDYDKLWLNSYTTPFRNEISDNICSRYGLTCAGGILRFDFLTFTSKLSNPADADQLLEEIGIFLLPLGLGPKRAKSLKDILNGTAGTDDWTKLWTTYISDPKNDQNRIFVESRLGTVYKAILGLPEYQIM